MEGNVLNETRSIQVRQIAPRIPAEGLCWGMGGATMGRRLCCGGFAECNSALPGMRGAAFRHVQLSFRVA
jgi:hypothetical protein